MEHKVYFPSAIGHSFVASAFENQFPKWGPERGPVTESSDAAARYQLGRVAVCLYAELTSPENLNPVAANYASEGALEDATESVVKMAVDLDARYRDVTAATSTVSTLGKDFSAPKGLPGVDVRPRLSRE